MILPMNLPRNKPLKWSALIADGKNVKLISPEGGFWIAFEAETPLIAEHIVREITLWARQEYATAEFKSLCQAGD